MLVNQIGNIRGFLNGQKFNTKTDKEYIQEAKKIGGFVLPDGE